MFSFRPFDLWRNICRATKQQWDISIIYVVPVNWLHHRVCICIGKWSHIISIQLACFLKWCYRELHPIWVVIRNAIKLCYFSLVKTLNMSTIQQWYPAQKNSKSLCFFWFQVSINTSWQNGSLLYDVTHGRLLAACPSTYGPWMNQRHATKVWRPARLVFLPLASWRLWKFGVESDWLGIQLSLEI